MKRPFLFFTLLLIFAAGPVQAAQRPTLAVLPFGVARDRSSLRWMGPAVSATLAEKLRRVPSVRVVPVRDVLRELEAARIAPDEAAWTPAVAAQPLGRWLGADVLVIGALGKTGDRDIAAQILEISVPAREKEKTDLWLAARFVQISTGETLGRAFVEGRLDSLFHLQQALVARLGEALKQVPEAFALDAVHRIPGADLKTYRKLSEAAGDLLEIQHMPPGTKKERAVKRTLKNVEKALKKDPQSATAHTLRGALLTLQNAPGKAALAYKQAADLDPDFTAPRYGLADLAYRSQDLPAAVEALRSVLKARPWDDTAFHLLGEVHLARGDSGQALDAFQRALELYRNQPETLYQAAELLRAQGRPAEAVPLLQEAIAITPGESDYHAALAGAHLDAGDLPRARQALSRAENLGAINPALLLVKGQMDLEAGMPEKAVETFETLLQKEPERPDVLVLLGVAHERLGRHPEALDAFHRALANNAPLPETAIYMGMALNALNQPGEAETVYRNALAQAPERTDIRFLLIKSLLKKGDRSGALTHLKTLVQQDPDNREAHFLLAELFDARREVEPALRHYEKAVELGLNRARVAPALAQLYLERGDAHRAREACLLALETGPPAADLYAGLGRAEELLGNTGAARAAYRKALDLDAGHPEAISAIARLAPPPSPRPAPVNDARRARDRAASGDLAGARTAFRQALKQRPNDAGLWNDLGAVSARQGEAEQAEAAFEKAIALDPQSPEAPHNLGRLFAQQGRLDKAEDAYRHALERDPSFVPAATALSALHLARANPEAAVAVLEKALEQHPGHAGLSVGLGNARLAAGNISGAQRAYRDAIERAPGTAAACIGLGNAAFASGDTLAAVVHYQDAVERAPADPAGYLNLGSAYVAQGRLEEAASRYREALDLAPDDPAVYLNLAVLYFHSQQYGEALSSCKQVLDRDPESLRAHRLIGRIAHEMGEYEDAVNAYRSALALQPDDPETHRGLAAAHEAAGDNEQAAHHWEKWLDLVAGNPAYRQEAERVARHIQALRGARSILPFL